MKRVAVLIFDGCMPSSVVGPADLFNIANSLAHHVDPSQVDDLFDVRLLSVDDQPVHCKVGLTLTPTMTLSEIDTIDLLLIGGFQYNDDSSLSKHLINISHFNDNLKKIQQQGSTICAFCTGSFTLAQAGLLDHSQATVSWWLAERFSQHYPNIELVMDKLVVDAGQLLTAGATTAYTSLCLSVIGKMASHQLASQLSRVLLVDNNRLSQLPYMNVQRALGHKDKAISDCQYWLQHHLAQSISIKDMSEYCAMSERTFIRRFKAAVRMTPSSYLQQLRVDAAKQLLENTDLSLERIVNKVGYDDVSAFRRLFTKLTQLTPRGYRSSFA